MKIVDHIGPTPSLSGSQHVMIPKTTTIDLWHFASAVFVVAIKIIKTCANNS